MVAEWHKSYPQKDSCLYIIKFSSSYTDYHNIVPGQL